MGADIYVYVEKRNKNNNEWEYIFLKNKEDEIIDYYYRNSILFGALAGVRAPEVDGFTKENRGFPLNMSAAVKAKYEKNAKYYYGMTWYSVAELNMFMKYIEQMYKNAKKEFKQAQKTDANNLEWKEEDYYYWKDVKQGMKNFLSFIELIADYNSAYSADDVRVIMWFDNQEEV